MKRNLLALSLIILVISYLVFMLFYIDNVRKDLSSDLEQVIVSIDNENFDDANDQINKINEKWDKKTPVLASYYNHDDLELITTTLFEATNYTELQDKENAYLSIKKLLFLFEHIYSGEKIKIDNIF